MATLRQILRGTATLTGASVVITLPTALLDTGRALVLFTLQAASLSDPQSGSIAPTALTTTELTFARTNTTGGGDIAIAWTVIEWSAGATVQRGVIGSLASGTGGNAITISTVDPAQAVAFAYGLRTGIGWGSDDFIRAEVTGATTLTLYSASSVTTDTYWQVLEHDAISVQYVTVALPNTTLTGTAALGTAVDQGKTWLAPSTYAAGGNSNRAASVIANVTFDDDSTIRATKNAGASSANLITVGVAVVTFSDDTTVQRGSYTFVGGDNPRDEAITAVDLDRAFAATAGGYAGGGTSPYTTDDNMAAGVAALTFADADTLTITHGGLSTPTIEWQVVELPDAGGGAPTYAGTGSAAPPAVTASGVGTFVAPTYAGTGSAALPAPLASGAGAYAPPIYAGAGAAPLPAPMATGAGTHIAPAYAGAGAAALPGLSASGVGVFGEAAYVGAGAGITPPLHATGSGAHTAPVYAGAGAAALPSLAGTGGGVYTLAYAGAGAASLPALDLTGAGAYVAPTAPGAGRRLVLDARVRTVTLPARVRRVALPARTRHIVLPERI